VFTTLWPVAAETPSADVVALARTVNDGPPIQDPLNFETDLPGWFAWLAAVLRRTIVEVIARRLVCLTILLS
jgi:hypothetical protein